MLEGRIILELGGKKPMISINQSHLGKWLILGTRSG